MSPFCFCFALLAGAAAVSCRLYHTVPQARKLSAWWQPRYNSSRTTILCGPLLGYACFDTAYARVCAMIRVRLLVFASLCICVLEPHIIQFFCILIPLLIVLLLLPYHVSVCVIHIKPFCLLVDMQHTQCPR